MALDFTLKLKEEKNLTRRAEQENSVRDAAAIAYAGKI